MMDIPGELVEQFARGNGMAFVGAGLSQGAGLPGWADLVRELAAELDDCPPHTDPRDIAQYYDIEYGRQRLVQRLRDWLDTLDVHPTPVHEALVRLPVPAIFTTNYDSLLEQALRTAKRTFTTVIGNADASFWSADRLQVVKLHGDLNQPESIVITAEDYERFATQRPTLARLLATSLQMRTVLFLGYTATDPDLRLILTQVRDESGQFARNLYTVQFGMSRLSAKDLERRGLKTIDLGEIPDADTRNAVLLKWLQDLSLQIQNAAEPKQLSRRPLGVSFSDGLPTSNPFFYGNPAPHDRFLGRRRELRRIVGRIVNQGQSTAVVGEPRSGKTSMLLYLAAPETREQLYGADSKRLLFAYMDAQTFGGEFSQALFWEYALRPLQEGVVTHSPDSSLAPAYQICWENDFGAFVMERLLAQMRQTGWRLVLMLDEFDALLHHPILNCAEFFGSLRSLVSRSQGGIALVIASRNSLAGLNRTTQQFSRLASPYFNFLDEITLGPFANKDITELLRWAGNRFTPADRHFIVEVAGGHPYLLQVAASALWDVYEDGEDDPACRWQETGVILCDQAMLTLSNIWSVWSPETRKAFTAVAMVGIPRLLRQREFYVLPLLRDLRDLGPELWSLAKQGFVAEDETVPGGWRVRIQAFLWWLADEIVRTVRDPMSFGDWLRRHELGFLLTRLEKELLAKAMLDARDLLKGGAKTLIEATVEAVTDATV